METKLEKEVRFLKIYAVSTTLLFALILLSAFTLQKKNQSFDEINVERINIVEKDGKLRMVISNRERQHPGMIDGKPIPRENGRPPGLIFFNHRGDECGGLIFDENSGKGHFISLTFDKSRQDQTIGLQHLEGDDGEYYAGLAIWDRPHTSLMDFLQKVEVIKNMPDETAKNAAFKEMRDMGELGAERISIGKQRDKTAKISLSDARGRPRIRISVEATGNPKLEFLDETGSTIYALPEGDTIRK